MFPAVRCSEALTAACPVGCQQWIFNNSQPVAWIPNRYLRRQSAETHALLQGNHRQSVLPYSCSKMRFDSPAWGRLCHQAPHRATLLDEADGHSSRHDKFLLRLPVLNRLLHISMEEFQ